MVLEADVAIDSRGKCNAERTRGKQSNLEIF